jgi:hypothetical protein
VRAEAVEDEAEHGLGAVLGAGCGAPEGAGELEEVAGVGVVADGAVVLARVQELGDGGDDGTVGLVGGGLVPGGAENARNPR